MEAVSIAIASIGRPSLADTVRSLAGLSLEPDVAVSVLVADDSRDGAATRVVEGLDLGNLAVTCLPVAAGNISVARNALLDAATGDWIALVDDDEWVEPDWLSRLMAAARDFDADVVVGPVYPDYPADTPDWFVRANPLYNDWGHRGKRLITGRGGNTLMKTGLARRLALRFDPTLGVSGGEDTAFFAAAAAHGAVIVATDDARAHEHVPPERLAPSYVLRRAVRSGQSYANARRAEHSGLLRQLLFALDAMVKVGVASALALLLRPLDRAASFRMRQKTALNLGKIRSVLGLPLAQLYKQPD
ncbi:succinoglycan biosynthesis protein ExoM [Breoghania corrubedonensis]|uniref:Succinoglycan biosynthesis protein ExoM n=1 Tax=Breoghania corrubedonensis TaxID=665038 RepID=A0A2T5VG51_9HYPH|nr:glycosyltransferase family 2 protein [Breoghania corrubedonensis]PTW62732.1 succinoglycan biosynthesis protein ExoM [Breoghania corrubedonensis]